MSVKRIQDIGIKNKGLFMGLYGVSGQEFYLDSDLRKYNFYQQLSMYLKEDGYDKVIMYDGVNNFHSYFKTDLEQLKYSSKTTQEPEKRKSRVKNSIGRRRKHKAQSSTHENENSSIIFHTTGDKRNGFYKDLMNTRIRDYFSREINNSKAKTVFIIKDFNNLNNDQQDNYVSLFREAEQNYIINNSENKVIIIYDEKTSESLIEKFHQNRSKLIYNKFFEEIFVLAEASSSKVNKITTFNIGKPKIDEIKNLLNRERLINKTISIKSVSNNIAEELESENFSMSKLSSIDLRMKISKIKTKVPAFDRLEELIGLNDVKNKIRRFIKVSEKSKKEKIKNDAFYHLAFTGPTGTGKTIVAKLVGEIYKENKIISGGKFNSVSASKLIEEHVGGSSKRTKEVCEKALDGVLFIDEAYTLANNEFGKDVVAELLLYMVEFKERLAIIFAGYDEEMEALFNVNEGLKNRIGKIIKFPNYSVDELMEIYDLKTKDSTYTLSTDAKPLLREWIEQKTAESITDFGNGRGIEQITKTLYELYALKDDDNDIITKEDIIKEFQLEIHKPAFDELNELIGLKAVKEEILSFIKTSEYLNNSKNKDKPEYHLVFTGNPGTGKTIVAKIVAKIFKEKKIIKGGKYTSKSASKFMSPYNNGNADNTNKICTKALGGVLFIDEAYSLAKNKTSGEEVITELIQFMENERERLVVIFAGYEDEMKKVYELNDGLESRIGKIIHFPDYKINELMEIFELLIKDQSFMIADDAKSLIREWIEQKVAENSKKFGNGRGIRKIKNDLISIIASKTENQNIVSAEDVIKKFKLKVKKNTSNELNKLIGLGEVKNTIKTFVERLDYYRKNNIEGSDRFHLMFTGNPGTGKTIVAELVAQIYKENKIVKGGKFTSISASKLIAGYVGQTAIKTNKVCKDALGGILFIDEAYAIAKSKFGDEAIAELLLFMENERGRFAVIFAGYNDDMDELLAVNEGLESRIGKRIYFPDYSVSELIDILNLKIEKYPFNIESSGYEFIENWLETKVLNDSKTFGNARGIEGLVTSILDVSIKHRTNNITAEILKNSLN